MFDKHKFTASPQLDSEGFLNQPFALRTTQPEPLVVDVGAMIAAHEASKSSDALVLEQFFYEGSRITREEAQVIEQRAAEARKQHMAELEAWQRGQLLAAAGYDTCHLPNPAGWNEPGMQPIDWAELEQRALLNDTPPNPNQNTGRLDAVRNGRAE